MCIYTYEYETESVCGMSSFNSDKLPLAEASGVEKSRSPGFSQI